MRHFLPARHRGSTRPGFETFQYRTVFNDRALYGERVRGKVKYWTASFALRPWMVRATSRTFFGDMRA
jgi:hypothetical protein